jgi:hypothetical protein
MDSLGADFKRLWKKRFTYLAKEVRDSGSRGKQEKWKVMAPIVAQLLESVGNQMWPMVFLNMTFLLHEMEKLFSTGGGGEKPDFIIKLMSLAGDVAQFAPKWF